MSCLAYARLGVIVVLFAVIFLGIATFLPAGENEDRVAALAAIRSAAAGRDLIGLKEKLAEAAKLGGEALYDAELTRLEELCDMLDQFWKAVDRGARKIQGNFELMVGDQVVAVVEFDGSTLILRVSGQNKRYSLANVPPRLCLTLAEQVLDAKNANNKVFFGTFLLLDGKGERKLARQYFDDAAAAKIDVARFLPEFDVAPSVPAIAIDLPMLTPAHRLALSEKNWQVRVAGDEGGRKTPLDGVLTQDEAGRLRVKIPRAELSADSRCNIGPRRTFNGNFAFMAILTDVQAGQSLRFGAPDAGGAGYTVALPTGTIRVELARLAGKLACRINGKEVLLVEEGQPRPQAAGAISITASPGDEFGVAAVEWTTPR